MWAKVEKVTKQVEDGGTFADESSSGLQTWAERARWRRQRRSSESGAEQELPRGEYVCGLCGW